MQNFILFYLWLFVMALSFMGTLKSTLCERNHIISLNWGSYCTLPGLGWELALWNEEVNEFLYCNRGERNIPSFLFCSSSAGGHLCYWGNPVHEVTNVPNNQVNTPNLFYLVGVPSPLSNPSSKLNLLLLNKGNYYLPYQMETTFVHATPHSLQRERVLNWLTAVTRVTTSGRRWFRFPAMLHSNWIKD